MSGVLRVSVQNVMATEALHKWAGLAQVRCWCHNKPSRGFGGSDVLAMLA